MRQPSTTLSQTLAACSGATPSGSGTSIASANGHAEEVAERAAPVPADDRPEPVHRPLRHREAVAGQTGATAWALSAADLERDDDEITGRNRRYPLPHLDYLRHRLVAERDRAGDRGLAADRRLVEVA